MSRAQPLDLRKLLSACDEFVAGATGSPAADRARALAARVRKEAAATAARQLAALGQELSALTRERQYAAVAKRLAEFRRELGSDPQLAEGLADLDRQLGSEAALALANLGREARELAATGKLEAAVEHIETARAWNLPQLSAEIDDAIRELRSWHEQRKLEPAASAPDTAAAAPGNKPQDPATAAPDTPPIEEPASPVLPLDAQADLVRRIADHVRQWRIEEAKRLVPIPGAETGAEEQALWRAYGAGLDRLAAFRVRLIAGLSAATRVLDAGSVPGLEIAGGTVSGASPQGVQVRVGGGQVVKAWAVLPPAGLRVLAQEILGRKEPWHAALTVFLLETGDAAGAQAEWTAAEQAGESAAELRPYYAARLSLASLVAWRAGVAEAEGLVAGGRPAAALDRLATVRAPTPGLAASDRRYADEVRGRARAGLAAEVLAEAEQALQRDRPEAAVAALEAALGRLGKSPDSEKITARLAECRRVIAWVLADFERPDDLDRWQVTNTQTRRTTDPDHVGSGSGALEWTIGEAETGGLSLSLNGANLRGYAELSLWVQVVRPSKGRFEVRIESSTEDFLLLDVPLAEAGAKQVRGSIASLRKGGTPDLGKVRSITIWHFPEEAGGEVYIDDLVLARRSGGGAAIAAGAGPAAPASASPGEASRPGSDRPPVGGTRPPRPPRTGPAAPIAEHAYVNAEYGILFTPPERWKSIPPPKEDNPEYRTDQRVKPVVAFAAPENDAEGFALTLTALYLARAASLDEALDSYRAYEQERNSRYDPAQAARPQRETVNRLPAAWLQIEASGGGLHQVMVVQGYGEAFALLLESGKKYAERKADTFRQIGRGFAFLNDEQVRKLGSRAGGSGASALPPGWSSFTTAHYEIQYNCDRGFAELLGKHLEAILGEYQRRFPLDLNAAAREAGEASGYTRFTVKAFKTFGEFDAYATANKVSGAAAYFSPAQNELACYKTTDEGRRKTFNILYHEASHQYMHLYLGGDVEIPTWLNEGVAEYFYGGNFETDGRLTIGVNRDRTGDIKEAVRQGNQIPFAKFFKYTQSQYYASSQLCYAQGWAVCYFLWTTELARYKGRLDRFYASLKKTKDSATAYQDAFGDLEPADFQKDWEAWVTAPGAMR
ncbi:MAG: DUF1570 domain-containing protein [Planctomycetes bacterium]|nr:DUF1570 domain-containing protein [Planctomycetota bacterium]